MVSLFGKSLNLIRGIYHSAPRLKRDDPPQGLAIRLVFFAI
jgi:hypothetical protein